MASQLNQTRISPDDLPSSEGSYERMELESGELEESGGLKGPGGDTYCVCSPELKIPRPRNAFILYRLAKRHQVAKDNPGVANPDISKIIGRMWKAETAEATEKWTKLAAEEKRQHKEKYPDYRYQPRRASKLDAQAQKQLCRGGYYHVGNRCSKCGGRLFSTSEEVRGEPSNPWSTMSNERYPEATRRHSFHSNIARAELSRSASDRRLYMQSMGQLELPQPPSASAACSTVKLEAGPSTPGPSPPAQSYMSSGPPSLRGGPLPPPRTLYNQHAMSQPGSPAFARSNSGPLVHPSGQVSPGANQLSSMFTPASSASQSRRASFTPNSAPSLRRDSIRLPPLRISLANSYEDSPTAHRSQHDDCPTCGRPFP